MSELRAKLASEVLKASWSDLVVHHARGGLVLVDGSIDLVDAAMAVAQDDGVRVATWMSGGLVARASEEKVREWGESPPWFQAVIVQPFVLAQVLPPQH